MISQTNAILNTHISLTAMNNNNEVTTKICTKNFWKKSGFLLNFYLHPQHTMTKKYKAYHVGGGPFKYRKPSAKDHL